MAGPEPAASPTFHSKSPLIATSYFYCYDDESKAHVLNGDGTDALTGHPPPLATAASTWAGTWTSSWTACIHSQQSGSREPMSTIWRRRCMAVGCRSMPS